MIVRPEDAPGDEGEGGGATLYLSVAGGLTQFGAHLDRLAPGALSSERHWHDSEDEFLYVLEGTPTVIDDDGEHLLLPGDAACWRHGDPNAHHVANRTGLPASFLILGSRVAFDICRYPDSGEAQVNGAETWKRVGPDGSVLRSGRLPAHLLDLAPRWGTAFDPADRFARIIRNGAARIDTGTPESIAAHGPYSAALLSDTGGLSQFGAFTETLMPGSRSSDRHWHEQEDEFLYVLDGTPTVIEDDGPHDLRPGDAACWPAGVANGHHVVNRSDRPCTCLVAGTRLPSDTVHYSDIDKLYRRASGVVSRTRRDGSPL